VDLAHLQTHKLDLADGGKLGWQNLQFDFWRQEKLQHFLYKLIITATPRSRVSDKRQSCSLPFYLSQSLSINTVSATPMVESKLPAYLTIHR
jgi:hypothetical protein